MPEGVTKAQYEKYLADTGQDKKTTCPVCQGLIEVAERCDNHFDLKHIDYRRSIHMAEVER